MPEKTVVNIKSKVSILGIAVIGVLALVHQLYLSGYFDIGDGLLAGGYTYGISALISGIVSLFVAKKYRGSEVFGKTYLALSISFLFLFCGDMTYVYYDLFTDEDPYPSIADVFFFLFYPFAAYHLVKNIQYFKKDLGLISKIFVPALALLIALIYAGLSIDLIDESPFDFYFGLIFVLGSSIILSLAVLGVSVFRSSILGIAWLMLASGIFVFTIADVWYYYLELTESYDDTHITNTLWVLGNMIIIYALIKHKKII